MAAYGAWLGTASPWAIAWKSALASLGAFVLIMVVVGFIAERFYRPDEPRVILAGGLLTMACILGTVGVYSGTL